MSVNSPRAFWLQGLSVAWLQQHFCSARAALMCMLLEPTGQSVYPGALQMKKSCEALTKRKALCLLEQTLHGLRETQTPGRKERQWEGKITAVLRMRCTVWKRCTLHIGSSFQWRKTFQKSNCLGKIRLYPLLNLFLTYTFETLLHQFSPSLHLLSFFSTGSFHSENRTLSILINTYTN